MTKNKSEILTKWYWTQKVERTKKNTEVLIFESTKRLVNLVPEICESTFFINLLKCFLIKKEHWEGYTVPQNSIPHSNAPNSMIFIIQHHSNIQNLKFVFEICKMQKISQIRVSAGYGKHESHGKIRIFIGKNGGGVIKTV